jgi:mono/diheme cytochrome c family protein
MPTVVSSRLRSLIYLAVAAYGSSALAQNPPGGQVQFNRDIRPILSDKCYTCHGPDPANRKTKLRFDNESGATLDLGGKYAIVPNDPAKSEMIRRITAENKAMRMPPASSGITLTAHEIELLRRWVSQGAKWQKHWSFIPPERPALLPTVKNAHGPHNEIDLFILDRLQREGLSPSPEADRERLIRRVTFDLTGLPPTTIEVDEFLKDTSPEAYGKLVDRLLASPRYGERMAVRWLDAARYADTNGYQTDAERYMWRWRDWVINAFNQNMPFDKFTVEQIAGDLLPGATLDQKIATGFNRNHRGNGEGGIIPEEYAVEYVVDRVDTTSTVWLGLTMGCARCHDHKYDPISQKEFYQVYAYFNSIPERGKAFKYGNSPPAIKAPTFEQQQQLNEAEQKLAAAEYHFTGIEDDLNRAQLTWEKSIARSRPVYWWPERGLLSAFSFDGPAKGLTWNPRSPKLVEGKIHQAANFDGQRFALAGKIADFDYYDKFTLAAWIFPTAESGAILTRAEDTPEGQGYSLSLKSGKVQFNLVNRWLDDGARVETEAKLTLNQWHHVSAVYDGTRVAEGIQIYVDGQSQKLSVHLDDVNQSFSTKQPVRIGAGGGRENRFHGQIDEARIYQVAITPEEAAMLSDPASLNQIAEVPADRRSAIQKRKLELAFKSRYAPAPIQQAWEQVVQLKEQRDKLLAGLPEVMVMQEMPSPRETFRLIRGAYDRPGEKVERSLPAILPPLPPGAPNDRRGFAKWLVEPSNPLTARVAVNRFWQMYFGTGLVKTSEDFGSQGEWPSHPELLDWLATEFIRTGWDVKAMQKTIVMSATYRQSSRVTPDLLQRDPENRLLAHGPRLRLSAEMVRDQALAISGLLVEKVGGPSVKPYQPAGLWKELSGGVDYKQDTGANLYRRSLYTFWKRASPPPSMMTFDSVGREICSVRENRTNTPLQALTLMNDVTYVEASRALAQRMMMEGGANPEQRIGFAYRLATARQPSNAQIQILVNGFHHHLDRYQTDRKAALSLLQQGESPLNTKLDAAQLAAYTTVASLILNLDAAVTKE